MTGNVATKTTFLRNTELFEFWKILSDAELGDVSVLQDIIERQIGLRLNQKSLQLSDALLPLFGGLQCKQYPDELATFLAWLFQRKTDIDSYLEIGVERGGTFFVIDSYLRRINPHFRGSLGIDLSRKIEKHGLSDYQSRFPNCRFQCLDSADFSVSSNFSLCLLDGDHREAAVRRDVMRLLPHVRYLALHDIASNLPNIEVHGAWRELREQYPSWEILTRDSRFPVSLGIGIVDLSCRRTAS